MNLILGAIAATVVFTLYWMAINIAGKKDSMSERVKRLAPDMARSADSDLPSLSLETEKSSIAKSLEQILSMIGVNVAKYKKANELRFYQAGLQSGESIIYYLFFKRILLYPTLLVAILIMTMHADGIMRMAVILSGMLLLVLALFGPDLYVTNSRQNRQKVLTRSFPDTLDLLLVCVESGLALDGALSRVCKELGRAHPEMTGELNRTRMELTLLNDRMQALQNLADRTDLVAFKSLVATLMQSEKFGTSLTDTLRVLSEDYRSTRLLAAENKAGRLPALMTIPLICFMMPAFFMIVLGPAVLKLISIVAKH
jgi:tight adherence protein C